MAWQFNGREAVFLQIADRLRWAILDGTYALDTQFPSVRQLAAEAAVNPNTMQRALAELERRGLVFSERTSGRFVTKDESILKALHEELAGKYFEELTDKLHKIGMSGEEITAAVEKWLVDIR